MVEKALLRWNHLNNQEKSAIVFFFSSMLTSGISYILTPVYTRLLSPEEYGAVSIFFTWQEIIGILAMFCLSYGIFNNGMIDYKETRDEFSFSMLILSNLITSIVFILLVANYSKIVHFFKIDIKILIIMFANFMTLPAYNFWISQKKFEFKYKGAWEASLLIAILPSIVSIVCMFIFNNRIYARIFGVEITSIIVYIFFYFLIARKNKFKVNTRYWKYAIKFNLPLIPHYLSIYLLSNSDRVMIGNLVGKDATAYYSLAYSIASIILVMWTAVNSSFTPILYENCSKGNYLYIKKSISTILLISLICCFLVILLAPEIITIISTKEYMVAIYSVPAIIGGVFFQIHYSLYASILYYYRKSAYVMLGSVVATVLNIVLNFVYINKYGFIAAGFTTLFCYLIQATVDYVCLRITIKHNFFDMKKIGLLSFLVLIVSTTAQFLYKFFIIRYIIISLICVFSLYVYKKFLKNYNLR